MQNMPKKLDFLKSGSMVSGLTKAFLGVGDNQKELSFSDHTHSLPDLDGILTTDKGGTGVSGLDALKTALGISNISSYYIAKVPQSSTEWFDISVPDGWVCYIAFGDDLRAAYRSINDPNRYYTVSISGSSTGVAKLHNSSNPYTSNKISLYGSSTTVAVVFY